MKKSICTLALGLALCFSARDVAQAQNAETPCAYPSICDRIPCYLRTPSIADGLSTEQIYTFAWFYYTWCW